MGGGVGVCTGARQSGRQAGSVDVPSGQDVLASLLGRPGSSFKVSGQLYGCLERHVEWVVTLPTTPPFLCAGVPVAQLGSTCVLGCEHAVAVS